MATKNRITGAVHPDLVPIANSPNVFWFAGDELVKRIKASVAADYMSLAFYDVDMVAGGIGWWVVTDMPRDYLTSYFEAGLGAYDPLMIHARDAHDIIDDNIAFAARPPPPILLELMHQYRLRNRTRIPIVINDVKIGSFAVTRTDAFTNSELQYLSWAARPLLESMLKTYFGRDLPKLFGLTSSEILCLQMASKGLSSERIAAETGYSFQTVNSYLKDATRKLKASNRTEAVVMALKANIIR